PLGTAAATLAGEQAFEEIAEAAAGATTAEDLLEIEALAATEVGRRVEFLARTIALRTQLIVRAAFGRVAQRLVGLVDGLELLRGAGFLAHIRMVFARQPPVGRLDLGIAGRGLDPQRCVVILDFHPSSSEKVRRATF